jgi:hypothetical protein
MTIFWSVWLFVLIPVSFAAAEGYALWTNKPTLSRYIWTLSKAFPPFPWMVGVVVGFLACHFWWGGITCFAPVTGG